VLLTGCRGGGVFDVNDPGTDPLLLPSFIVCLCSARGSVYACRVCGGAVVASPVRGHACLLAVCAGFNRNTYTMGDILQEAVYH
jgi:hypothetical protein